jgi:limonene-1,2-epoxide hydrolase
MDMESAAELLAEDCVYQNVPYHEAIGKERIQRDFARLSKPVTEFQVDMINVAVNGNTVLTERMDTFIGKGFRSELPVMGVFVVENGQITEWRDYFDWTFAFGRAAGAVIDAFRSRIGLADD